MPAQRTVVRGLLTLVFALTGFTALTLQVVWQRVIALHGGVDLYATTTVVAAFLGGLGIGSLVGGSLADRLGPRRSVLAFGLANVGVSAFALGSPFLFYDLYQDLESSVRGTAASFAFHIVLLIVPTTLMGLSLPLLARSLVRTNAEIGPLVGRLYAVNTLGAAAGAAASGWFLLGTVGFVATIRLAAVGNVLAAVVALGVAAVVARAPVATTEVAEGAAPGVVETDRRVIFGDRVWPWYLLYGLTGAVALGLEVVFFRFIDTLMRSNSYTFAHVLSLYLLLFGLGGVVGSRLVRRASRPDIWFLWLQTAAGLGALVGVLALLAPLKLPDVGGVGFRGFLEAYFSTEGLSTGFTIDRSQRLFATVIAPLVVMAIPVGCFGAAFPFVQALAARRVDVMGRHTGRLLFANVVGNVMGTLITGFVLLDLLGSSGTLRLLAGLLIIPGIVAASASAGARLRRAGLSLAVVGLAVVLIVAFPSNRGLWALLQNAPNDGFVVAEERSCLNTLAKRNGFDLLYINGAAQNGYPYDDFHVLIGALPSLLHPEPERGLAIGLGIGGTSYGMAADQRLDRVETVEICGGQKDLVRHLAQRGDSLESEALLNDERVDISVADGRKHLLKADEGSLDVVVVDTLRPQSGYSGNLYSREFYQLVRSRLAPGGLFTQWLPTDRAFQTMQETFPNLLVFDVPSYFGSRFAVASMRPIAFDREEVLASLGQTKLTPGFADAVQRFVTTAQPAQVAGNQPVPRSRLNEDLFPRDEYFLNNGF